jgi:hypothetical protein
MVNAIEAVAVFGIGIAACDVARRAVHSEPHLIGPGHGPLPAKVHPLLFAHRLR